MELYHEDLLTLARSLGYVEDIANQEGVFDVEIRIRFDDTSTWAVLAYGESGDPCIVRFDEDKPKKLDIPALRPVPSVTTINPFPPFSGPNWDSGIK